MREEDKQTSGASTVFLDDSCYTLKEAFDLW